MRIVHAVGIAVVFATTIGSAAAARAEPLTKVFINGVATPVYFNDGDSFRPMAGPLKGQQSRLSGYNTMESFGPAHHWGTWNAHELYVFSKLATLEARRGVWHCETDGKKDGFGRLLLFCKDLANALIAKGYAHTYSVDANPGDADLLATQRAAMKTRVGMWAHGVPRFVMTSLHSAAEGGDRDGKTSNRLISTYDAHTEKWVHEDTYEECQKVCNRQPAPTPADDEANVEAVKAADPAAAAALEALSPEEARAVVHAVVELLFRSTSASGADYFVYALVRPASLSEEKASALLAAAKKAQGDLKLQVNGKDEDSCFTYVDFRRRYGGDRAACLR